MSDEHEITKMILETMRLKTSEHKRLIRENEEMGTPSSSAISGAVEAETASVEAETEETEEMGAEVDTEQDSEASAEVSGQEVKDEESKFMDTVTPRVTFESFKVYPDASNVTFNGKFDNEIEWQMSKVDGLFVNAANIELDDEVLELLKKLNGYYQNWSDEWSKKLNTEYKKSSEE